MDGGESAHDRVVADLHMSRQRSIVGKDNFATNRAIVADVTVGEKISATANARFSGCGGASIHRDEFTERIFVSDLQISWLTRVFQVLRLLTDGAVSIKFISSAGARRSRQRDVMLQPAIRSEHDLRTNHAVRTDHCSRTNFRARIDNRRLMNLHVAHLSRNVNINSPSDTTASFTTQWHLAFANRSPRAFVSSA